MKIRLTDVRFSIRKELLNIIMRTFLFLFCTALFSLTPKYVVSQNEKIMIEADMLVSVDEVFKIVKKQTDYMFVYHRDLFNNFLKVQLRRGGIQLNELLAKSLSFGDISIIFTKNNIILIKDKDVQQFPVTGKVTDIAGVPISSVTVLIKGENKGTATNLNGHYTITVADSANVLVFSSLGFETQEIIVGNQTTINISLKENISALDQVIINAGYYNISERERTGSISKIEAKTIEKQPVNNPLAAMQGHISGMNIKQVTGLQGGGYRVQIRGLNFLGGSNEPLYIVNGVPYDAGSLESSNLAANILPGGSVSPLNTINPADIESIEVLKDADATAIYGSRGANGVVLITTKKGKIGKTKIKISLSKTISEASGFVDLLNTDQFLEVGREAIENDGYILETLPLFFSRNLPHLYVWDQERYTDWQEVLIGGIAYGHNAQLSFSGGNEHTQFLLSGGFVSEPTVFPGDSKYKKVSVHTNVNLQSENNRFKLNFSASYGSDSNDLPGTDLTRQARTLAPNAPALYDDEGNLNWENSTWKNPLAILETDYKAVSHSLVANTVLSYRPIPTLELKTSLGFTDFRLNSYSAAPHTSNDPNTIGGQNSSFSSITTNNGNGRSWIVEPQINWRQRWENASLNLLIGITFQQNRNQQLGVYGSNFPSNTLLQNLSAAKNQFVIQDTGSEYKYNAVFGRINFNWQDKYILNLTGRRDGSSRFGPGKQFGNFGAIGTAWIFSKENFLKNNLFLSFGKLRASYGVTGSDGVGDYSFYDAYGVSGGYNGSGLESISLFNSDYSWQENEKLETALDLGFWKDRVFLSAAWYRNRSSNQLIFVPLPVTTGFSGINDNFDAIVQNMGFEIDLKSVNIQTNDFKWTTSFNISANRNKLVSFSGLESSTFKSLVVGKSINIQRLYHSLGVDPETGVYQFEDYNNDGKIDFDDRNWIEDFSPKYFGGLGNTLNFKNLQLDMFFQFKKQKNRSYVAFAGLPGFGNGSVTQLDRWQQVGDGKPIQRYSLSGSNGVHLAASRNADSNAVVTDASFIRLRSVLINYTVPESVVKGIDINIYLQGQNLFVLTKYDGPDPEIISLRTLPPLRQFTLGLNLGF